MENQSVNEISDTYNQGIVITSETDLKIIFNTLKKPIGPNERLRSAAEMYKVFIEKNETELPL